ncbi:hypothetical protein CC80DRAFT_397255 [Byssothecium circinans]|uniref:BRCT domain-containing protein n=1 Tax=Byssothecium circinans TaxID=147558 RepID=A0A6A5UHB1_9PLEO|nr:hypothetical protein CC80DRAFT_397255 [Byssothecium circinans]
MEGKSQEHERAFLSSSKDFTPTSTVTVPTAQKKLYSQNVPSINSPPTLPTESIRPFLDAWNSSSTGHQRAENRLSGAMSWRQSRNLKLGEQYKGGLTGGKRVADTVGAGSEDFGKDGRKANGGWERGAKGLRKGGQMSLVEVWSQKKEGVIRSLQDMESTEGEEVKDNMDVEKGASNTKFHQDTTPRRSLESSNPAEKQIFEGFCFYLNGSTMPLISDHKLKHLLSLHGASHSIAFGRRTVTHVILGTTSGSGLAASKIEKEIAKTRGKGVKFVPAEWVLSSIKANRVLPTTAFTPLRITPKTQNSLLSMLNKSTTNPSAD